MIALSTIFYDCFYMKARFCIWASAYKNFPSYLTLSYCAKKSVGALKVLPFVQCDPEEKDACDAGCGGGLMTNAYNYVMEAGGLESESDYPYKGSNGKCRYDSNKIAAKVTNFTNIPIDEDQMAAYLVHQGPLAG